MSIVELPDEILSIFSEYKWEGNVRELRNVIQRSAIIASQTGKNKIEKENLPSYMQNIEVDEIKKLINLNEIKGYSGLEEYIQQIEKRIIIKTLEEMNYNKSETAKKLRIPRATLYYKMDKYEILK